MKNILKIFVLVVSVVASGAFVCGCNESYISPDYVVPADTIPYDPVREVVPVVMSMKDPAYVTLSRGMGAIAADRPTVKNNASFYVYSFLTNNYDYSGAVDYTKTFVSEEELPADEPMYCLIDDPETGMGAKTTLSENEVLEFAKTDIPYYYSQRYQERKYNFFAYHIDDAEVNGVVREKDNIHMNIKIDGTQDIITSVAGIKDSQLSDINPNTEKLFLTNVLNRELVFSTLTGHRFIIPVFEAKHNLSRFVFNLVGEEGMTGNGIYVQDIYAMAHRDWELTVAADDMSKLGMKKLGEADKNGNVMDKLEPIHLCDDVGEVDGSTTSLEQYAYSVGPNEIITDLGMGLLLPPRNIYDLYIKCAYKADNGKEYKYIAHYALSNRVIADDGTVQNLPFEAGKQYNVTIHVYGYRKIELSMDGLSWGEPIDIPIDEDDIMDFEDIY